MIKIGVHMPVWKRETLTRSVARYHASLDMDGVDLLLIASCTRRTDVDVVRSEGWGYVQVPNEPLTRKHNMGVHCFLAENVDGVVHLTSDDYLSKGYFEMLRSAVEQDLPCVTFRDQTYLLEGRSPRCVRLSDARPGSGTYLSRRVLERIGYRPWQGTRDRHLDKLMLNTVEQHLTDDEHIHEIDQASPDDVQIMGVKRKEAEQMWTLTDLMEYSGPPCVLAAKPYVQRHYSRLLDDPLILSILTEGSA